MKKILTLLIVAIIVAFTSCGGGSSEEAKELLSQMLAVVGIPQDIIVNICQDENDDGICSELELDSVSFIKKNFFSKVILGEDNSYELRNYDPTKKIIMELQDSKNVEFNDGNFSLEYKGTSTELSILQSMVDNDDLTNDDTKNVKNLEDKDTFYNVLLGSLEKNLNQYMKNDIDNRGARDIDLKELGRVFKEDIPLKELPTKIKEQCNGDTECIKSLIKSFTVNLDTDEQRVYTLVQAQRKAKLLNDKLIDGFSCQANERKIIKHYGFEDLFSLKNREELTRPSLNVIAQLNRKDLVSYDSVRKNKIFADSVRRLPRKFRKGAFLIGFKKSGGKLNSRDKIYIGQYKKENQAELFSANLTELENLGWLHRDVNSNDPTTAIYYTEFKNIKFNDGNKTLLDYLTDKTRFDVVVEKNTAIDFISVATCSLIDPKAEIYEALNAFKCQDKSSKLVKIIGGNVDAFSKDEPDNNTTPSELLRVAVGDRPTIGYDEFANNKTFIDSLNTHNNDITITEAQFSVGIKPIEKYLYQNDTIHIGNYELGQYARFRLYGRDEDSVYSLWNRDILISNGERVIQAKLSDINLTNGDNSAIYNIFNKGYNLFDILIQNDTSVDFTYLNMCIK
jgi:hypothetical protein